MSDNVVNIANGIAIIDGNKEMSKKHQTEIFEYIRRRKGNKTMKVGVILGTVIDNTIKTGWSKCNLKAGDKFNAVVGLQIAMNRAMASGAIPTPTPKCIRRQVRQFGARAVRYFKDATKLELPV